MAPYIAPPEPSALLPPLLACLPTAFVSSRPPPALLPLLSPILRQRVQILTSSEDGQPSDGWLPLLCWKSGEASELSRKVEDSSFEPHPVSGEIELGDVSPTLYRRQDEETLQALLKLLSLGLQTIYVWCENDPEGGSPGWRLSELRMLKLDLPNVWSDSIWKANDAYEEARESGFLTNAIPALVRSNDSGQPSSAADEDDEDDYWARYDANSVRATPAPEPKSHSTHVRTTSEAEYYARYAGIEQTIDDDANMQAQNDFGPAGGVMHALRDEFLKEDETPVAPVQDSEPPRDFVAASENLVHTRPSSSYSAANVAQLEDSAENHSQEALAVQQHIGTSIKSLYRLARATGIKRAEFQRLVKTELDLLEVWDDDDD